MLSQIACLSIPLVIGFLTAWFVRRNDMFRLKRKLDSHIADLSIRLAGADQKMTELQADLIRSQRDLRDAQSSIFQVHQDVEEKKTLVQKIDDEKQFLRNEIKKAEREIETRRIEADAAKEKLKLYEKSVSIRLAKLDSIEKAKAEAEIAVGDKMRIIEKLQLDLVRAEDRVRSYERASLQNGSQNQEFEYKIHQNEIENAKLRNKYSELEVLNRRLSQEVKDLSGFKIEYDRMKESIEDWRQRYNAIFVRMESAESKLDQKTRELLSLQGTPTEFAESAIQSDYEALAKRYADLEARMKIMAAERNLAKTQAHPRQYDIAPTDGDDLKSVNGIGPVLEEKLNSLGIYFYSQIANWNDEDIRFFDEKLDQFKGRILRDAWVESAKICYEAKYVQGVAVPLNPKSAMA